MSNSEDLNVKFKPIGNIKPEIYIPFLYTFFIITIIIFFVTFPAIINKGSYLTITSSPGSVNVYLNNERVGVTPLKIFVKKGKNSIELKKNGFDSILDEIDIKNSYTLSRIRKDKVNKHYILTAKNGEDLLKSYYNDASKWSLINSLEITKRYRQPFIISEPIIDYYNSLNFEQKVIDNYLESSLKFITNSYILSDYLRGLLIVSSDNRLPSISSVIKSSLTINSYIKEYKDLPLLVYSKILNDTLVNEKTSKLLDMQRLRINKHINIFSNGDNDLKVNDLLFKFIPKSDILTTNVNFIHEIKVDSFYIAEDMISRENYEKFLIDVPFWNYENKDFLIEKDLVDKYYLDFYNDEEYITNVSYNAAVAWVEWANNYYKLPTGYKLALPTENMWYSAIEYKAFNKIEAWQWTSQGFFLYDHFLTNNLGNPINDMFVTTPRLVVGQNKYNSKIESNRGVQDANWCTPYIGIRPVLIKE